MAFARLRGLAASPIAVTRLLAAAVMLVFAATPMAEPLSALPPIPSQTGSQPPTTPLSRFDRTVRYLGTASAQERADFAVDALGQLAEVFMAEADLARTEAAKETGRGPARLRSWSIAVDQYTANLLLMLDDAEQGFPVDLSIGPKGDVSIIVAGRAVILAHPRPAQQPAYEQMVLESYCNRHDCDRITPVAASAEAPRPIPITASRVSPRWTFTGMGPLCSHAGLVLRFGDTRNLANLRELCSQLMQELETMVNEFTWQERHGVEVDWKELRIAASPGRPEHLVSLNGVGDSILVTVPVLAASPGLLADVSPWLRARLGGERAPVLELDAATYGWTTTAD